jgi:hypothetical protein
VSLSHLKSKEGVLMCALFDDNVSSADYIASNNKMIGEQWTVINVEGSGRGLICDAALYLYV